MHMWVGVWEQQKAQFHPSPILLFPWDLSSLTPSPLAGASISSSVTFSLSKHPSLPTTFLHKKTKECHQIGNMSYPYQFTLVPLCFIFPKSIKYFRFLYWFLFYKKILKTVFENKLPKFYWFHFYKSKYYMSWKII